MKPQNRSRDIVARTALSNPADCSSFHQDSKISGEITATSISPAELSNGLPSFSGTGEKPRSGFVRSRCLPDAGNGFSRVAGVGPYSGSNALGHRSSLFALAAMRHCLPAPRCQAQNRLTRPLHRTPGLRFGFNASTIGPASVSLVVGRQQAYETSKACSYWWRDGIGHRRGLGS